MEPAGCGATWTASPKGVFAERKHHKPRQGAVARLLVFTPFGAVGFIDWLGVCGLSHELLATIAKNLDCTPDVKIKEHKA